MEEIKFVEKINGTRFTGKRFHNAIHYVDGDYTFERVRAVTVVRAVRTDASISNCFGVGVAMCSITDTYNEVKGDLLARGRALKQLEAVEAQAPHTAMRRMHTISHDFENAGGFPYKNYAYHAVCRVDKRFAKKELVRQHKAEEIKNNKTKCGRVIDQYVEQGVLEAEETEKGRVVRVGGEDQLKVLCRTVFEPTEVYTQDAILDSAVLIMASGNNDMLKRLFKEIPPDSELFKDIAQRAGYVRVNKKRFNASVQKRAEKIMQKAIEGGLVPPEITKGWQEFRGIMDVLGEATGVPLIKDEGK